MTIKIKLPNIEKLIKDQNIDSQKDNVKQTV